MSTPEAQMEQTRQLLWDHWDVLAMGCVFQLLILGMAIWAIVHYFLKRRYSWRTRRLALIYIGIVAPLPVFNAFLVSAGPLADKSSQIPSGFMTAIIIGSAFLGVIITVVAGAAYTATGAYFSRRLGLPHFPLLRGLNRAALRTPARRWRFPWAAALAASGAFVGYSALLFWLTKPTLSPLLKESVQAFESIMLVTRAPLAAAMLVALLAVKEEFVFRLFLQTQFEWWLRRFRHGGLWAILITSVIWTMGHAGVLEPSWVKFAQIFPMGVILGVMRRRWGLEAPIFAHVVLNLLAVFLLQDLVGS